jgi:hypothetical protein
MLLATILLPIISAVMGIIGYRYPFNTETEKFTKVAKLFGVLAVISVGVGIYIAIEANRGSIKSQNAQDTLNIKIANLTGAINSMGRKMDSVGYRFDKATGKLVHKVVNKSNVVKAPIIKANDLGFVDEIPRGEINDINKIYTISHVPIQGTLQFFYNGVKQPAPEWFSVKDTIITLKFAPSKTSGSGAINVTYRYVKD